MVESIPVPAAEETSVGQLLQRYRRERRLTVENVAVELNLTADTIRAIERADYAHLPEPVYTRGYIRAYARFLRLDGDAMAAMYVDAVNIEPAAANPPLHPAAGADGILRRRSRRLTAVSAIVAVTLIGLVLAHWQQQRARRDIPVAAPPELSEAASAAPLPAPVTPAEWQQLEHTVLSGAQLAPMGADPDAAAPTEGRLVLRFEEACWTEIRDANGNLLVARLADAGERLRIGGQAPLSLLLGNAHGATLEYDGRPMDLAPYTRGNIARLTVGEDATAAGRRR